MDLRQRQKLRKMQKRRKRRKIFFVLILLLLIILGVRSCTSCGKKEEAPPEPTPQVNVQVENEPKNITPETEGYVEGMALDYKIMQLFVVEADSLTGVENSTMYGEKTQQAITDTPVGGILYRSGNIETKTQLGALLSNTQTQYKNENGFPVFLIAEEEGGELSPVADKLGGDVGNMSQFAQDEDYDGAKTAGGEMGKYMKSLGFNMTLAPNLSIDPSPRSFANDAETVSSMAVEFASGVKKSGIVPVFKSFPASSSALTLDELKEKEFLPFQVASNSGADVIMVSGDIAPQSVGQMPCYNSSVIVTDTLRGEIGFDGIIMTAPLQSDEDAVSALLAGCDMLLMPKDLDNAIALIKKAVENGEISEERIDNSVKRIIRVKTSI